MFDYFLDPLKVKELPVAKRNLIQYFYLFTIFFFQQFVRTQHIGNFIQCTQYVGPKPFCVALRDYMYYACLFSS